MKKQNEETSKNTQQETRDDRDNRDQLIQRLLEKASLDSKCCDGCKGGR